MTPHYLEVVTEDVDAVCAAYEAVHGVSGPLRPGEAPVVRPYWRVLDVEAALTAAAAKGAVIAMAPTDMPGRGRFAIYIQGGVDHGVWEV